MHVSPLSPPLSGEVTMDHAVPFQCSISVWLPWSPTAQQSDAEEHVTSERKLSCVVLALGELTMDHAVPFQCSISVWWTLPTPPVL